MTLDFTEQEGRALLEMLDLACKAGGIRYAEAAVIWSRKIVEARAADGKANMTLVEPTKDEPSRPLRRRTIDPIG